MRARVTLLLLLSGCIPTQPPAQTVAVPEAPPASAEPAPAAQPEAMPKTGAPTEPAGPVPNVSPAPAQEPDRSQVALDLSSLAESNAMAKAVKLTDGEGYSVEGSYGLEGTIKQTAPNLWQLDAKFSFPSGGYKVGTPYPTAMGDSLQHPETDLLEYKGPIMIHIPVQLPAKGAMVTQAIQEVPIKLDIHAGADANFSVVLVPF